MSVASIATLTHGYTMARVDRLAHEAANRAGRGWIGSLNAVDAREEAWQGIVELLYLTPEKPSEWSLVEAGIMAINSRVKSDLRDQGRRAARDGSGGYEDTPKFEAYWVHIVGAKPDWTDALVERWALPKVLGVLTPGQYEAVAAMAAHGSYEKAASALNISYAAFATRLDHARSRMLEAWFDGETPHTESKKDPEVECRYGHLRADHAYRRPDGRWTCRRCKRNATRRARARAEDEVLEVVDDEPAEPVPLTFAPPPETTEPVGVVHRGHDGWQVVGSTACWCGLRAGHDWPHKGQGAPHPADLAAAV